MPPPLFSSAAAGSSQHPQQVQQYASVLTPSDLPKPYRANVRAALQYIQVALTTEDEAVSQSTALKAFQAIKILVDSTDLHYEGENDTHKGMISRGRVMSSDGPNAAMGSSSDGVSVPVGKQVRTVLDTSLFDFFSDAMDQDSQSRRQLLISFLHALRPILDPHCVVLQWWDILLRPMLKDPYCNVVVSRKAQQLVIWAMSATPQSSYVDEQASTAVWPAPDQSSVVAAAAPRVSRKPGDAPYPASSTRSISQSRSSKSSEDGEARFASLYSTTPKRNGPTDPMRRFTQRIFDLYTSEASSASSKTVEDDEIEDFDGSGGEENDDEDERRPSRRKWSKSGKDGPLAGVDLDLVSPTWKGNLEAIILTFGEQRSKAFFHHLSDSFLEPTSRVPILLLLTIFFRLSSSHAYHVVHTPFVRLLVLSLQLDTSKTSTSLGILALVTLIPHFPNSLASGLAGGLPALLSIYARIVDWKKLSPGWEGNSNAVGGSLGDDDDDEEEEQWQERLSKRLKLRKGLEWNRLESTYDTIHSQRPNAECLFTVLYGIFPCNVVRFLRAPIDYLRKAEYHSPFEAEWEDIIDETSIQQKSAPILRRHVLHPALVEMTAEREITDTQRWSAHDSANTTADCASLFIGTGAVPAVSPFSPTLPQHADRRILQSKNYSGSTFHDSDSAMTAINLGQSHTYYPQNDLDRREVPQSTLSPTRRFSRQRSVSESVGRRSGRSPLSNNHTLLPPIQFRPLEGDEHVPPSAPRHPSTWDRADQDDQLRNHVALRIGSPLVGVRSSSSGSVTPKRSGSSRTSPSGAVRSFNTSRTTMASTVMSPDRSSGPTSGLARSINAVVPSSPVVPSNDTEPEAGEESRAHSDSLSHVISPLKNGDRSLLDSPALSSGGNNRTAMKKEKISYLKQENLQLRNELNYEIGQKDQLLRHIGTIHGKRVQDTALDEALQNLYHSVKSQKIQLKILKDELEVSRAEARQSKNRQASWQGDLTAKVKAMREEKKAWGNEVRILKIDKEDREEFIGKLERQLDENAGELFDLREQAKKDVKKVEAIREYEDKIARLETCLRFWDEDMQIFERQSREMRRLLSRWEEMTMLVEAGEDEVNRARAKMDTVERDIREWQRKTEEANQTIVHLKKRESQLKMTGRMEASSSSSSLASASLAREDAEKVRMKKRIAELEVQLLDAKIREEERQSLGSNTPQDRRILNGKAQQEDDAGHDLLSEHSIVPLQLGEAARLEEETS
ncbi:hypothetical protein CBS101457_001389 [Exobasidium rhododendri]|nr:hypothetical protein CBS101457_001389 [Exobasidium rhododendri]